jgi:hypothetical protein
VKAAGPRARLGQDAPDRPLGRDQIGKLELDVHQPWSAGAVHSLAICMLHQTPISISRGACLAITDFAEDPQGRSFAILGRTPTTQTPWRIGQQARESGRLISPHTKNPNLLLSGKL